MGGPFTLIAIYLTIWWTVLFAILPLGTQTRAEAGLPNDGSDPGAPVDPKLKRKFITTTWVSGVVFAILWLVIHFKLIDLSHLPWGRQGSELVLTEHKLLCHPGRKPAPAGWRAGTQKPTQAVLGPGSALRPSGMTEFGGIA